MKRALRLVLAAFMVFAGVMHFARPDGFVRIVPAALPFKLALVYVSGAFEIILGAALLAERTRRLAAFGLMALFVAVLPANINMAVNHIPFGELTEPALIWARLPLQAVLIAWAYWFTKPGGDANPSPRP